MNSRTETEVVGAVKPPGAGMKAHILNRVAPWLAGAGRLVCSKCAAGNPLSARACQECLEGLYVTCRACGAGSLRARGACGACGVYFRNTLAKRWKKWLASSPGRWVLWGSVFLGVAYSATRFILAWSQPDGGG